MAHGCGRRPIGREQQTVDMDEECQLSVHSRHDPCIVARGPVAEAAATLAIWDALPGTPPALTTHPSTSPDT
ncbi:MAG: chorismate synthase [Collinsella aerofaciens]